MSQHQTWIQTWSGGSFDYAVPRAVDVRLGDIARALSHQCRFAGHVKKFYSVAEHCWRMSRLFEDITLARQALLHDAAEAYVMDLPAPLKRLLEESVRLCDGLKYSDIEESVTRAIGIHFGVELCKLPVAIKRADRVMLATEKRDVLAVGERDDEWEPQLNDALHDTCEGMHWDKAATLFCKRAAELGLSPKPPLVFGRGEDACWEDEMEEQL